MFAFIGPCPIGKEINHIDGDKTNNNVSNLEYCTSSENKAHAKQMGLTARGIRNVNAKLDNAMVTRIRLRAERGERTSVIAKEYGLSHRHVNKIVEGKVWTWLK
jgi:hypothetical protein